MKPIEYYHHIDNGGILITFSIESGCPVIEFSTQYFGHAHMSSKLQGYELNEAALRDIANKFNEFADVIEETNKG